ncbi:uncharacterized protein AAG666_002099 [Megaptera novaeangliae]
MYLSVFIIIPAARECGRGRAGRPQGPPPPRRTPRGAEAQLPAAGEALPLGSSRSPAAVVPDPVLAEVRLGLPAGAHLPVSVGAPARLRPVPGRPPPRARFLFRLRPPRAAPSVVVGALHVCESSLDRSGGSQTLCPAAGLLSKTSRSGLLRSGRWSSPCLSDPVLSCRLLIGSPQWGGLSEVYRITEISPQHLPFPGGAHTPPQRPLLFPRMCPRFPQK